MCLSSEQIRNWRFIYRPYLPALQKMFHCKNLNSNKRIIVMFKREVFLFIKRMQQFQRKEREECFALAKIEPIKIYWYGNFCYFLRLSPLLYILYNSCKKGARNASLYRGSFQRATIAPTKTRCSRGGRLLWSVFYGVTLLIDRITRREVVEEGTWGVGENIWATCRAKQYKYTCHSTIRRGVRKGQIVIVSGEGLNADLYRVLSKSGASTIVGTRSVIYRGTLK
jgi:hypothetical protein